MVLKSRRGVTTGIRKNLKSFVDDPHAAIDGPRQGEIVNLADHRAARARDAQLELIGGLGPDGIVAEFAALTGEPGAAFASASRYAGSSRFSLKRRLHTASARHIKSRRRAWSG
jgi:hypothetical protein